MSAFQSVTIIENRVWRHTSGKTVSIYGAVPYQSESEKQEWEIVTTGYTWECLHHDGRVTIGACRVPAKTYEEAVEIKNKLMQ